MNYERRIKRISIGHPRQSIKELIIEFPGGMVQITCNRQNSHGQNQTIVDVSADGDRYAGNSEHWAVCMPDDKGVNVRIVQGTKAEVFGSR